MKTVCIIQSRLNSTRLPGKALILLDGKPMIQHVVERAKAIASVDQVVLAVPTHDLEVYHALGLNCLLYGGSELDVLERYVMAAREVYADLIVRITGDCPLLIPAFGESGLGYMAYHQHLQYLALCQPYCMVADGWDIEIFTRELLEKAHRMASQNEREHVVTWMRNNVIIETIHPERDYSPLTCSVNTQADLERVQVILDQIEDKTDYDYHTTWAAWEKAGRP